MRIIVRSLLFVIACTTCVVAEDNAKPLVKEKTAAPIKLTLGKEHVIVRGIRPEEQLWGPYQFPRPYRLGGRLVVSVHVKNDDISNYGAKALWFESRDQGQTWKEIDDSVAQECGLLLPNGDRVYLPPESGIDVSDFKTTSWNKYTPAYDFSKQAKEGVLPIPDGMTYWMGGTTINAFNADRLPPSLAKKEWTLFRIPAGETKPVLEHAQVDWPYLTRVVHVSRNGKKVLKSIFPRGNPKLGPDGAIWVSVFSGEGHLNPENGQYSPYYSAEIFRSEDNGRTFKRRAHLEYEADGHEFPYKSGGFSDSDFEFMPDGSIVWFLRSTWYSYTGKEWDPMYMTRSTDGGRTWSKPIKFDDVGILPRLCQLDCGVTLLCYARPGTFVRAALNEGGTKWTKPLVVMTPNDRSALANKPVADPTFHDWDGSCNNPEIIPLDKKSALIFYSDFYYPDETGVKRKTILCRKITVERTER